MDLIFNDAKRCIIYSIHTPQNFIECMVLSEYCQRNKKNMKIGTGHFFVAVYDIPEWQKKRWAFQPGRVGVECLMYTVKPIVAIEILQSLWS